MASARPLDSFRTRDRLQVGSQSFTFWNLGRLPAAEAARAQRLPTSLKVLLENLLRREDGVTVTRGDIEAVLAWEPTAAPSREIQFMPARVVLQDFTGVPCVVDLAAMRDTTSEVGGDAARINPLVPVDLVIDHSVQVDRFGDAKAAQDNVALEHERNRERYTFLRWGAQAFRNLRVVPPGTGIVHQVNLEHLAPAVFTRQEGSETLAYPDTVIGTDSHTTMINGLGVLGWGVGGIEAEAAMLGQPMTMLIPQVVGVRLTGRTQPGVTATDVVLTVTELLRKTGVVEKFVEFFGEGLGALSLADRATLANMAPEYGATVGFFPIDERTLEYLAFTGRSPAQVQLVEAYARAQGLFRVAGAPEASYSQVVTLDLSSVAPSLAGPSRPQDRVPLPGVKASYRALHAPLAAKREAARGGTAVATQPGTLADGSVVIAAITSCTNTSNPSVLVAAGLVARKAVERGLVRKPWVKTSLAPGSRVVTRYLEDAGLLAPLAQVGFALVGYGCTTCIGNSGPLIPEVSKAVKAGDLTVAAVLSGNRNFEGRVNPQVKANYLASPPLVVAYALAGTVDIDLSKEPLGTGRDGKPVYLADLWPSDAEVQAAVHAHVKAGQFADEYARVFEGDALWRALPVPAGGRFAWDAASTYVKRPSFLEGFTREPRALADVVGARALALLGDSVTTDHISPAGNIEPDGPAARWLKAQGVEPKDFNSYGARRGNHEVMMRGTFANIRLKNKMVPGVEGGVTVHQPSGERMAIHDAAERYRKEGVPLVVLAGKEYGTGSSRDWAAKGTLLLGVKAVIAASYERIHRSNLVGMGVLPLQLEDAGAVAALGLDGSEAYAIAGIASGLVPGRRLEVQVTRRDGTRAVLPVRVRIDTPNELEYYRHGGIINYVLRQLVAGR
ncbi:MAG: aconitate hydratase AcnA [Planctomycetia bacterium]